MMYHPEVNARLVCVAPIATPPKGSNRREADAEGHKKLKRWAVEESRARQHSRSQTNSSSWRRPNRQAKRRSSGQAHSTRRRQIPKVVARRCQGCAPRFHSLFGFRPASDAFRPLQPAGAPSSSWGAALRPMAVPTSRVRGRPAQRRCKKKPKGWMCHDLPRRRDHVLFRAHG